MYDIQKKIKIAELKYMYSKNKQKNINNFFTRNPKYFAPTDNLIINWACHIFIGDALSNKIGDIYYDMTNGGAIFYDLIIYPIRIIFEYVFF